LFIEVIHIGDRFLCFKIWAKVKQRIKKDATSLTY
jgi:hypothetical protein